jgi:transposase
MDAAHQSQAPRRRGPKLTPLVLTDEERATLVRWARRRTSSQALALRCRIVLACAEGASNVEIATRLGVSLPTVGKWRSRFLARRLEGLHDEPRPGARRTITDEQVERVIATTLETTPTDATHWSTATNQRLRTLGRGSRIGVERGIRRGMHPGSPGTW